ncbi:hypothetical protein ATI61_106617 [Archangium gephyra]|uniref:Uncharacterized protein n=1 Tax=Archangium gephyra TaxID=48 RepID=A0AAC8Q1I0_9BACT|nr:hypothetical protein [Archangium gephyra]AKI99242.1 Hypothetical protein AA314_00869 [Archangium gephyra]REG31147.1 hypothetical protein ATI61_106617 [Archangium gephyra]
MPRTYVKRSLRLGAVLLGALAVMGFRMAFTPDSPGATPSLTPEPSSAPQVAARSPGARPVLEANAGGTPVPTARQEQGPGALPPRMPHARAPQEWQGMQVDLSVRAMCGEANHCGLAASCTEGRCGPCGTDSDCSTNEACVLDHCVPRENVACRTRHDCPGGQLCALSGYSSDPRGNAEMRAYCLDSSGGTPRPAEPTRSAEADSSQPREPVVYDELMQRLSSEGR